MFGLLNALRAEMAVLTRAIATTVLVLFGDSAKATTTKPSKPFESSLKNKSRYSRNSTCVYGSKYARNQRLFW